MQKYAGVITANIVLRFVRVWIASVLFLTLLGYGGVTMAFELTSTAFGNGEVIAQQYTCDGPDISPPLKWIDPPAGTKSLALICDDPDAPVGIWVHWVIYGLSPDTRELSEGVPKEEMLENGRQGKNDFGRIGYGGPCPPRGPAHRYFFTLYALNIETDLSPGMTKAQLLKAMEGHILAEAKLMGRYGR
jgi:Raf kinase inhibitor-like YbhB/YbcL family protein